MHANKPQPGLSEKAPGPGLSEHGLRTVLLLAFGGLLALMLVASVSALLSLRQLHAVEQQVASRFLSRTQALSEVVISVHIDRKSTRLNSSHTVISYAVFCLKKKK